MDKNKLSTTSVTDIKKVFDETNPTYICGHNFIDHDKKFLQETSFNPIFNDIEIIDTLFLSMLLYVNKKTHKLDKPYKTEINIENQPLGDAEQTKELFRILDKKFDSLSNQLKDIFINLLYEDKYFVGYFKYKNYSKEKVDIYDFVKDKVVCTREDFLEVKEKYPTELSYVISYLYSDSQASISSVILIRYPFVVDVLKKLTYDKEKIDLIKFSNDEFNIPSFREFEKESNDLFSFGKISQKDIVESSLDDTSILAILPTGGGKTFTFQLPALIKAKAYKGLTVVISPLQALMKNHVDSFKENNQNFRVVAISGYLSPIERMNLITEVENGVVDILYLAPEALRSNSVFKALKKRVIERFVIDEAHCFSSWGHDFRHDYYFIATTIKELENQENSKFQPKIPVSCFTATAKPEVLNDIKNYFALKLDINLKEFIASSKRYNLEYKAIEVDTKKDKYNVLVQELASQGKRPTIVYIPQNARECRELSEKLRKEERLSELNLDIEPFYSKIDYEIENGKRIGRNKSEILNDFISNKIDIVIATTAFGMGIDKPDIQTVIHYEQSDSLESYLQESGRGARKEEYTARCIVLYSKEDFNRTFSQLNKSKLDYHEIDRIVKVLKREKRDELYISPRQLAKQMGIDTEDSSIDYETMIKTALLELEQAGVIERGRNSYKIFATSVEEKNSMDYVHSVIDDKKDELAKQYQYEIYNYMILVMNNIIQKSKKDAIEVDDLAEIVGIERKKIFDVLYELQKNKLIEYNNDISIFVHKSISKEFKKYFDLEKLILKKFEDLNDFETSINLREINSEIDIKDGLSVIKKIIQSWAHLSKLKANIFNVHFNRYTCNFELDRSNLSKLIHMIKVREETCKYIIDFLINQLKDKDEDELEVSTNKLKIDYDGNKKKISLEGFHHSLVYLHELTKNSFKLRKGRLIYYQTYKISKKDNIKENTPYRKRDHYNVSLKPYYERKIESIHIQISFIERLVKDGWSKASSFVKDYFGMEYSKFKKKYKFNEEHIKLPVTQERLKEIIYDLNEEQKKIFEDDKSDSIMVLAGPGSGKTKTLVHKIASLVTIEQNKPEYFLMLAHSRVAVAEFRDRLQKLMGNQIYEMKIFTFHSFAVNLLGKKIDNKNISLINVIEEATKLLNNDEIELPYIQMLVLDEYQDVGSKTYNFIKTIYSKMTKGRKIIAVGDDDQCINNFGEDCANIAFINQFEKDFKEFDEEKDFEFNKYSLLTNYRSKMNIVNFSNKFRDIIPNKLKKEQLLSKATNDGEINLTYYQSNSFIKNIVNQVKNDTSENIAVLLRNNEDILTIFSELVNIGINVKYITSKDGFSLGNIIELQDFLEFWKQNNLTAAKNYFDNRYNLSKNYKLANKVIDKFLLQYENQMQENPDHFIMLFEEYLKEITFEEFEYTKANVVVSTMHKAKGKEFDSVYIGVDDDFIKNDYDKRLLYVAITRAKKNLNIHTKSHLFDSMLPYCSNVFEYSKQEEHLNRIVFIMGLGDIVLSDRYSAIGIEKINPIAGDICKIVENNFGFEIYKDNMKIARLSKPASSDKIARLSNKIIEKLNNGYQLEENVEVDYVVHWFDSKESRTFKQVLCRIYMKKV
ncbi:MAG: RecQ family ATP-dependent DNA helicase [Halarcobacter sp.]